MSTKVNHRSWLLVGSLVSITFVMTAVGSKRKPISPPQVPDNLKVPDGQAVLLKALGKGVQIYACAATAADPGKFDWSLKAPEADLTNEGGKKIAKHYAGPTWEANDGSKVVGELPPKKADAPRPGAVPWLLLKAKSNEGTGTFAKVTYIQRVGTEGGVAPTAGCDQAHANTEARVDYRANYYFYAPQR
jgi:hypothetical protein